MGKNIDLKAKFREYFNELEGYGLRSERFYDEFESGMMRERRIIEWIEAAYLQGARDIAQDTLDTLGDYACAVAGLDKPLRTPAHGYNAAHESLMVYYTKVLDDAEPEIITTDYKQMYLKVRDELATLQQKYT